MPYSRDKTLTILDWDNTLCPSTEIDKMSLSNFLKDSDGSIKGRSAADGSIKGRSAADGSIKERSAADGRIKGRSASDAFFEIYGKYILLLDDEITTLFKNCILKSTTVIVTNATSIWAHESCKKLYPKSYTFISNGMITIISAREMYENTFETIIPKNINNLVLWKVLAYKNILEAGGKYRYIISFGDTTSDHIAIKTFESEIIKTKFVKFLFQPTVEQLYQQIKYINKYLLNSLYIHNDITYLKLNVKEITENVTVKNEQLIIILFIFGMIILISLAHK